MSNRQHRCHERVPPSALYIELAFCHNNRICKDAIRCYSCRNESVCWSKFGHGHTITRQAVIPQVPATSSLGHTAPSGSFADYDGLMSDRERARSESRRLASMVSVRFSPAEENRVRKAAERTNQSVSGYDRHQYHQTEVVRDY